VARGERVRLVDNLSTGQLSNIAHLMGNARVHFVRGDILDEAVLPACMENVRTIYHLAAVVGVQRVMEDPLRCIEENIFGTRAVLERARESGASVFVASTSEVYGKNQAVPFSEESDRVLGAPQVTRWSYSTSKAVDEIIGKGYEERYGLPVVVGRFFNTIGRRQTGQYGMVVPRLVEQALEGKPLTVYGDGAQTRSFCDVRDTVRAVVGLMTSETTAGEVYNIGAEREISIRALAELIGGLVGPAGHTPVIQTVPYEDAYPEGYEEFPRRVPDIGRIRETIGWQPTHELEETIRWIADGMRLARSA
jgi:UDP-glucose 4-epimerase